ncbi:type IV pilin protein [Fibrobacter sp. UWEL]|uniref:type IV pilin protein n=1 Tax=Fibrobacter sp. UWEL TaxID=1896209 RepID=UPI0009165E4A|nr:prepilin-type N-terminal cleavage/methylation domain-containing protein [Fibrobacter sp. UWEL]SHK63170.1 prepilin-type N-terminal cleavage/methylation domain-containing protein [Fibrobacter sp. UWEL]
MHKNHKTGFTLVELMVVIVIMGILAGVAIPKLTNSVTKAKASEVAPAANTYIKLQNAYVMEKKRIGSWRKIGYTKPKSDVFTYDKADIKVATNVSNLGESGLVGWKATNKAPLGGCTIDNEWTVTILNKGADSDGNIQLEYKSDVSSSECAAISGDWGVVGGNTQVAASSNEPKTEWSAVSRYELNTNADGTFNFGGALWNGQSSQNDKSKDKNFSTASGTYYLNYGLLGADAKQTLLGGTSSTVKILSAVDLKGDETLVKGHTYEVTQTLYYGYAKEDIIMANTYGSRKVYFTATSATGGDYCYKLDANGKCSGTNKIDMSTDTSNWVETTEDEKDDPMKQTWNYPSPLLKDTIEVTKDGYTSEGKMTLAKAIVSGCSSDNDGKAKSLDKNDQDETTFNSLYNVSGYVKNDNVAAGTDLNNWLKDEVGSSANTSSVKILSELHTTESVVPGNIYAATQSLYYGDANGVRIYGTRVVYAVMTQTTTKANPRVRYYYDLACKQEITLTTDTTHWVKSSTTETSSD